MKPGTRHTITLASTLALGLLGAFGAPPVRPAGVEWGYTARDGSVPPVDWGEVSEACRTGESQSPIALGTLDTTPGDATSAPEIHYGAADLVVVNNGHTIEAEVEEGAGEIHLGGVSYELLQFHVHRASEHMVDGELFPAEIHLVHADADGNLAVLGILLREGSRSIRLNPFFRAAGRLPKSGKEIHIGDFDLGRLVPREANGYYQYAGSLTTPPCSEGVSWWVWEGSTSVGPRQLERLLVGIPEDTFPQGNRRPVQGRNGRPVYRIVE